MDSSRTHSHDAGDDDARALLASIVESSFDAIISKDLESRITTWNAAAVRLFGYTAEEAVGSSILMLIPTSLRGEETDIIARIRAGERIESFETTRLRKDGTPVAVSITISPLRNRDGVIVGASKIARDITESKLGEHRVRVLLRELNHRVKNQFAIILSMIRETGRHARSPVEFQEDVRDRIMALARSHDMLVESDWNGADLGELLRQHMAPFNRADRINVEGDSIRINANAVQNIGMAFHELATNAAKYGALSDAGGRIAIRWAVEDEDADTSRPILRLSWEENSAARAGQASLGLEDAQLQPHSGFGTVVLRRVTPLALGGSAQLVRNDGHVSWILSVPLASVRPSTVEGAELIG